MSEFYMGLSLRPQIITGNWKMYKTYDEAHLFVKELIPKLENCQSKIYLAVPYTLIQPLVKEANSTSLVIGAQNMNDASEGAFTGEIAGIMLKDAGAQFVLIGHSERRRIFNESNDFINRKVKRAFKDKLQVVLCVGETKEEFENEKTQEILRTQLTEGLKAITLEGNNSLIVAYEPVWAIGTNENATPEIAQQTHLFIREVLSQIFSPEVANEIVIQYGGSVNALNSEELLSQPDIDGLLVGGASLSLETFVQIIHTSESVFNRKVESV